MASMSEVAKRAGVSVATVSRLVNGTSRVDPQKADRIRACMKELGFDARRSARGPRGGAPRGALRNVLLLSPSELKPADLYRMPAFPALAAGMHEAAEAQGLNLVLSHSPDGKDVPPALANGQVEGVILIGRESGPIAGALLAALSRVAVVATLRGHEPPAAPWDAVTYDNRSVGPMAARHFHERGLRRVACATVAVPHRAYDRRAATFAAECSALGLEATRHAGEGTVPQEAARDAAERAAEAIAKGGAKAPQAIFCVSDDLMLELANALARRGIKQPGRVELLGCNNDPAFLAHIHPRPATIDILLGEVGHRAIEQLQWRMANPGRPHVEVLVQPVLRPAELPGRA